MEAMLRSAGFEIVTHPEDEVYICRKVQPPYDTGPKFPLRSMHR
jgi:tRNA (mo5U34)-methyltransferase